MQHRGDELQAWRAPQLLGERAAHGVHDVDFTALEGDQPRGLVGDHLEDEPLDGWFLAPIAVERLHDELHPGSERCEPVRSGADRRLFEAFVADLLDVLLGNNPARAGRRRVKVDEVGPGLLQPEPNAPSVHHFHGADALLQRLGGRAAIPLERKLHVFRGDGLAVVKAYALAQDEVVCEVILRYSPGFGEAWCERLIRHGFYDRVVDRVVNHVRRSRPRGFRRVEPRRRQRDVHTPRDLIALGVTDRGRSNHEQDQEQESQHQPPPKLKRARAALR